MKQPLKSHRSQRPWWLITPLVALLMLNCQAIAAFTPTETPPPTATATSTPRPTPTASPTATPLPDISNITIVRNDLPRGFVQKPLLYIGIKEQDLQNGRLRPEDIFIFSDPQNAQTIVGFRILLVDSTEISLFDAIISKPESTLELISEWTAISQPIDPRPIPGFDDIGETRNAMRVLKKSSYSGTFQIDGVAFRRGNIFALILLSYREGYQPTIKLHNLASILDERIKENLLP